MIRRAFHRWLHTLRQLNHRLRRGIAMSSRTLYLRCPLAHRQVMFRSQLRIGIELRNEIAVALQESCCEDTSPQVLAQSLDQRTLAQVGLFKELTACAGVLGD